MRDTNRVSPRGPQTEELNGLEVIFLGAAVVWLCAMLIAF